MNNRRQFLGAVLLGTPLSTAVTRQTLAAEPSKAKEPVGNYEVRSAWVQMLTRVAEPVLANLAVNQLKARMPVECPQGDLEARRKVTHLEAIARTLAGIAPWLTAQNVDATESATQTRFAQLTRRSLTNAVDPASADALDFTANGQNLVDAAFLALGLARGRAEIWDKLDIEVRKRLIAVLQSTRKFTPGQNNWLLFSAMIEAFLASVGAEWRAEPVETAFHAHQEWYKGDGIYGDGPEFHWDYYNSFVIQPFLLDALDLLAPVTDRWVALREPILARARRYAAVQERMIAPDGSYPPHGRSITYRCGAFHHLAAMALRGQLPEHVQAPQVRGALSAVIQRTLGAPGTFDDGGWLRIGLAGHQPALAENYISTGSLYLCTTAFLPLGLTPSAPFWSAAPQDWIAKKVWAGEDAAADHKL